MSWTGHNSEFKQSLQTARSRGNHPTSLKMANKLRKTDVHKHLSPSWQFSFVPCIHPWSNYPFRCVVFLKCYSWCPTRNPKVKWSQMYRWRELHVLPSGKSSNITVQLSGDGICTTLYWWSSKGAWHFSNAPQHTAKFHKYANDCGKLRFACHF